MSVRRFARMLGWKLSWRLSWPLWSLLVWLLLLAGVGFLAGSWLGRYLFALVEYAGGGSIPRGVMLLSLLVGLFVGVVCALRRGGILSLVSPVLGEGIFLLVGAVYGLSLHVPWHLSVATLHVPLLVLVMQPGVVVSQCLVAGFFISWVFSLSMCHVVSMIVVSRQVQG